MLTKQKKKDFIEKWHPSREKRGKGTQENCSDTWVAVSGLMGIGLVSRLSLASHSDSGSLVVHKCISQNRVQQERCWEADRAYGLAPPLSFQLFSKSCSWW